MSKQAKRTANYLKAYPRPLLMIAFILCSIVLAFSFGFPDNTRRMSMMLTVANANDSGPGSLRDAIAAAASGDTIVFDATFFATARTITLTSGELIINKNLIIQGPGADLLTISGNNTSRVFTINSGVPVGLRAMKITGGNGVGATSSGVGGGILNSFGTLTITGCTVAGNTASGGGGIFAGGSLTVVASTISGNTATGNSGTSGGMENIGGTVTITSSTLSGNSVPNGDFNGGAITSNLTVNITNSTITNNSAAGVNSGSGIYRSHGSVTLRSSIVAGNVNNAAQPDIVSSGGGSILSNGYNLIGNRGTLGGFTQPGDQSGTAASPLNPVLGPLADNGGPTRTHALLSASTALDKGDNTGSDATTDQRGLARTVDLAGITNAGDGTDIGAYEAQTAPGPAISGTVTYGNAIGAPNPRFVSNVFISGAGSPNVFATTGFPDGTYVLSGFGAGSYTVTPSKTDGVNGSITSFDAAKIAQHAAGVSTLTGNALVVADVSGNGMITSFDAALVARYAAGLPPPVGSTGNWIFIPANRAYQSITADIAGQDYTALLMGEVSGNWIDTAATPTSTPTPTPLR